MSSPVMPACAERCAVNRQCRFGRALLRLPAAVLTVGVLATACVPEIAIRPDTAVLQIYANPTAIPIVDGVSIISVFGFRSFNGEETLPDGTEILFATNVGIIEERVPMERGVARATLRSNGRAGQAFVTASTGQGLTATLVPPVLIGNAEGLNLVLTAHPPGVLGPDFTSDLVLTAFDNDNNVMPQVPVVFSATAGALASQGSILLTNVLGQAFDRLTLRGSEISAEVVAFSGSVQSNKVRVTRAGGLSAELMTTHGCGELPTFSILAAARLVAGIAFHRDAASNHGLGATRGAAGRAENRSAAERGRSGHGGARS